MLKCRDITHRASDYLERTLTPRERLGVALHLLICGKCRAFVRHLRLALETYRHMQPPELTEAEAADIVKRTLDAS